MKDHHDHDKGPGSRFIHNPGEPDFARELAGEMERSLKWGCLILGIIVFAVCVTTAIIFTR